MSANNAPLMIFHDPLGSVDAETGERSPLWSASDAHGSAPTLKRMTEVLLETGWDLSTKVMLPDADEPVMLSVIYKAQHEGKLPKNFAAFQREARVQQFLKDHPHGRHG